MATLGMLSLDRPLTSEFSCRIWRLETFLVTGYFLFSFSFSTQVRVNSLYVYNIAGNKTVFPSGRYCISKGILYSILWRSFAHISRKILLIIIFSIAVSISALCFQKIVHIPHICFLWKLILKEESLLAVTLFANSIDSIANGTRLW